MQLFQEHDCSLKMICQLQTSMPLHVRVFPSAPQ
jgi:hypothetical protein